jgi:hypothetical protein
MLAYFPAQQILVLQLEFTALISKAINMKTAKCSLKHHSVTEKKLKVQSSF